VYVVGTAVCCCELPVCMLCAAVSCCALCAALCYSHHCLHSYPHLLRPQDAFSTRAHELSKRRQLGAYIIGTAKSKRRRLGAYIIGTGRLGVYVVGTGKSKRGKSG